MLTSNLRCLILFLCLEAIEVSVAPIVAATVVAVKGQPEVALSSAESYGNNASPTTEAAVGIAEFSLSHSVLAVNAVLRTGIEIVSAHKENLTVNP